MIVKRVLSLFLSGILLFSIAACHQTPDPTAGNESQVPSAISGGTQSAFPVVADSVYFGTKELEFIDNSINSPVEITSMVLGSDQLTVLVHLLGNQDYYASDIKGKLAQGKIKEEDIETTTDQYWLWGYDLSGKRVSQLDISSQVNLDVGLSNMLTDKEGNLYLIPSSPVQGDAGNSLQIIVLDSKGQASGKNITLPLPGDFYLRGCVLSSDNLFYLASPTGVLIFDQQGKQIQKIENKQLDIQSIMGVGQQVWIGAFSDGGGGRTMAIDANSTDFSHVVHVSYTEDCFTADNYVYWIDQTGIKRFDPTNSQSQTLFEFQNSSLVYVEGRDRDTHLAVISVDSFFYQDQDQTTGLPKLYLLTRQDHNPNAGRQLIVLGGLNLNLDTKLQLQIHSFNESQDAYWVEMRDYMAEEADPETATKKMNLDLMSDSAPDILYIGYDLFSRTALSKMCLDLNTIINQDPTFKREDYWTNILDSRLIDGKQYTLPIGFTLTGLAGATSILGKRTGWTAEEFMTIAQTLPKEPPILGPIDQVDLLVNLLSCSLDSYFDSQTGQIQFDVQEFYDLVQLARTYGMSSDQMNQYTSLDAPSPEKTALIRGYVTNAAEYQSLVTQIEQTLTVVGYPSPQRSPASLSCQSVGIINTTKNPMGAWTVVKSCLEEPFQNQLATAYFIPVLKSAFEEDIRLAMNPTDESTPAMTKESADDYRQLIAEYKYNPSDNFIELSTSLYNIINEEAAGLFTGGKSEQETAQTLTNRLQTLLNEQ